MRYPNTPGVSGDVYTPAMLLDRALRSTFRNFSTLFLLVAVVAVPLHLGHAVAFRSVLAVRELHPDVEDFGERKRVRGVGREDLAAARRADLLLAPLELALLPFLVGAARRTLEADQAGEVPTVFGALGRVRGSWRGGVPALAGAARETLALVLFAFGAGWVVRAIGLLLSEPLPPAIAFAGVGLAEGLARGFGGALLVGGLAGIAVARGPAAEDT
jgi:hypothetical protein